PPGLRAAGTDSGRAPPASRPDQGRHGHARADGWPALRPAVPAVRYPVSGPVGRPPTPGPARATSRPPPTAPAGAVHPGPRPARARARATARAGPAVQCSLVIAP